MDKNKINKISRKFDRTNNPPPPPKEPAFDCTANIDDLNPLYPQHSNRMYLTGHISDDCMRSILWQVLEMEGLSDCSNEELCQFMRDNNIGTETDAAVFALNYIANKENKSIDDYCL